MREKGRIRDESCTAALCFMVLTISLRAYVVCSLPCLDLVDENEMMRARV